VTQLIGVVPLEGRDSLPFVDLHREPMFLHAVRVLLDVDQLDGRVVVTADPQQLSLAADDLRRHGLPALVEPARAWWAARGPGAVVLHDPLCPLVPVSVVERSLRGRTSGEAVVCFRPVTDTIKTVVDEPIVDTIDRDLFAIVTSPVVFDADGSDVPPTQDFAELAAWLRARGPVTMRKAPSIGRRVDDPSAVNLLECMDELARTVRKR